jgi:hypothetical protein
MDAPRPDPARHTNAKKKEIVISLVDAALYAAATPSDCM